MNEHILILEIIYCGHQHKKWYCYTEISINSQNIIDNVFFFYNQILTLTYLNHLFVSILTNILNIIHPLNTMGNNFSIILNQF